MGPCSTKLDTDKDNQEIEVGYPSAVDQCCVQCSVYAGPPAMHQAVVMQGIEPMQHGAAVSSYLRMHMSKVDGAIRVGTCQSSREKKRCSNKKVVGIFDVI